MKKSLFLFIVPVAILSLALVGFNPAITQAQTSTSVQCPVGYTCTPVAPQPVNCPAGYICTPTVPVPSPTPVTQPIPGTPYPITSCYVFLTNLQIGSTGADVVALQTWLIGNGFNIPDISSSKSTKGYFGQSTYLALIRYQTSVELPATGFFGSLTRAKLNASCTTTTKPHAEWSLVNSNIASNAGVVNIASSSLVGTIVLKAKATGGAMIKPVSRDFGIVFTSGTGNSFNVQPSILVTPNEPSIGDGAAYIVTISGVLYSSDPQVCTSLSLFMAIKDIDSNVGGIAVTNQTWGIGDFHTNSQLLTVSSVKNCSPTTQPSITVLSPNGGETYKNDGSPITVNWYTSNVPSSQRLDVIRLRAYPGGQEYNLASNVLNDGQEVITIPSSIPVGAYTLEIKTYVNRTLVMDSSDSYFKIVSVATTQPSITVLSPNGGETYKVGDTVNVRWNTSNFGALTIWLTLADKYGTTVPGGWLNAAYTPNTGSYSWVIPNNIIPSGTSGAFRIVASSMDNGPSASDLSDSYFTITSGTTQPSITLSQNSFSFTAHQGDTQYQQKSLTATNVGRTNTSFRINVPNQPSWLNSGYTTDTIIAYPNSPVGIGASLDPKNLSIGTYNASLILTGDFQGSPITIPINVEILPPSTTSTDPKVTVSPSSVASGGTSFIGFTMPANTISASLVISCPAGVAVKGYDGMRGITGTEELCGKQQDISVYASGEEVLLTNTSSITANVSVNFSVRTLDNTNSTRFDSTQISIAPFPSTQPSITVLSPNGGETLEIGKPYTFKWKVSNLNEPMKVNISLYNSQGSRILNLLNGCYGCSVSADVWAKAGESSYTLTVPDINSVVGSSVRIPPYKIEVMLVRERGILPNESQYPNDLSDAPFTITAPTPQPERQLQNTSSDLTSAIWDAIKEYYKNGGQ